MELGGQSTTTTVKSTIEFNFDDPPDTIRIRKLTDGSLEHAAEINRTLIITTGDASDADGFISVAMYAKTGADLMFIMNLPAMYGPNFQQYQAWDVISDVANKSTQVVDATRDLAIFIANEKEKNANTNTGKKDILTKYLKDVTQQSRENAFAGCENAPGLGFNYKQPGGHDAMKLTKLCYHIVSTIWEQNTGGNGGKLFFTTGPSDTLMFNAINPFGHILKSEFEVYAGCLTDKPFNNTKPDLKNYDEVYMDGNGSFAFYDKKTNNESNLIEWFEPLLKKPDTKPSKLKAISLMAGVEMKGPDPAPLTLGPWKGMINRLAEATMNQVYSPGGFVAFVKAFHDVGKWYITTNNEVNRTANYVKDFGRLKDVLAEFVSRGSGSMLETVVDAYYTSDETKRKLFDVMSSLTLTRMIQGLTLPTPEALNMYTEPTYGVTIVGADPPPPTVEIQTLRAPPFPPWNGKKLPITISGGVTIAVKAVKFIPKQSSDNLIPAPFTEFEKMLRNEHFGGGINKKKTKKRANTKKTGVAADPKWVSTGRKVTLRDGRARVVYRNARTGELRVRRKTTSRATGKVSFTFVKV